MKKKIPCALKWGDDLVRASHDENQPVFLALPRSEVFVHRIVIPHLKSVSIEKVAADEFPIPQDQLYWSHQIISANDKETTLVLAGASRERVETYKETLTSAKLVLAGVWFDVNKSGSPFQGNPLWLIPPASLWTGYSNLWTKHGNTVLAGVSVVLVALGLALGQTNARTKFELTKQLKQLKDLRIAGKTNHASTIIDDRALPALFEVIKRVPSGVCLVDYNYEAQQKTLFLRGRSANYAKVSEFTKGLSSVSFIKDVHGEKANLVQMGTGQVVEFSIQAVLQ